MTSIMEVRSPARLWVRAYLVLFIAAVAGCSSSHHQRSSEEVEHSISRYVDISIGQGPNVPLTLVATRSFNGSFIAPESGNVRAIKFEIGNNLGTSDGMLVVTLCQGQKCVSGEASLAGSHDNQYFFIPLKDDLSIKRSVLLSYKLSKLDGSVPVSVWSYGLSAGAMGMVDSQGKETERMPRVALGFSD